MVLAFSSAIGVPNRAALSGLTLEQREREDAARIVRQRPILRVCSELAVVGVIRDSSGRSGGEWIMKALKDLVNYHGRNRLQLLIFFAVV